MKFPIPMWKITDFILPWRVIRRQRRDLEAAERRNAELREIIYEIDPYYWTKKVVEMHRASPRSNCYITGITHM